jgi:hypothetical protein
MISPKAASHLARKAAEGDDRDTCKHPKLRHASVFIRIDQILIVILAYGGFTLSEPQLEAAGTYFPGNQHGRDLETFLGSN